MRKSGEPGQKKSPVEETRSREEILKYVSSLLYPERSLGGLSYLEGAGGPIRIIPTGVKSERLQALGIDLAKVTESEANTIYEFLEKVTCLDDMVMILAGIDSGSKRVVMPKENSKYFEVGRERIKKRVGIRMERKKTPGRMITLTYDPVRLDREKAWRNCGIHVSALIDMIKVYLKRKRGIKKINYFWVIEEQKGTGFPHFHLFIQDDSENGKAGYIPQKLIKKWWGKGGCHITMCDASIRKYITKYIGKVDGMSVLAMASMWKNKRRLYGFSRVYILPDRYRLKKYDTWFIGPPEILGKQYDLVGMFHPVKGFGVYDGSGYLWAGNVPIDWLMDPVENPDSMGYAKLKEKLWEGGVE